ncbi:MAG: hypothetical protein GX361_01305 [Bacteroidales bacterium]|nr:hypothetical protein [Bacteroidales bacterium]
MWLMLFDWLKNRPVSAIHGTHIRHTWDIYTLLSGQIAHFLLIKYKSEKIFLLPYFSFLPLPL